MAAAGAFRPFRTLRPVTLPDFVGEAQILQGPGITFGDFSLGGTIVFTPASPRLALTPGLRHTVLQPQSLELSTGRGYGASLGTITGARLSLATVWRTGQCCRAPGGRCTIPVR